MRKRQGSEIGHNWYKGNVHIHSNCSDGYLNYSQIARVYAKAGYDFIFITDHMHTATIERMKDLPLLALNGVEIHGKDDHGSFYHVVGLDFSLPIPKDFTFAEALNMLKAEGAITVLAHPHWTGNSLLDALRYEFDGVEIYNHVCHLLNGKSLGLFIWDHLLERNPRVLGFSVDDSHMLPEQPWWNGGWIMVKAPSLDKEEIVSAIRNGNFYSTQGPEFRSIEVKGSTLYVETSKVRAIRLVGSKWQGKRIFTEEKEGLFSAEFSIKGFEKYLRIEIEDFQGRRAWTNNILD
jgi:hypothetical protein